MILTVLKAPNITTTSHGSHLEPGDWDDRPAHICAGCGYAKATCVCKKQAAFALEQANRVKPTTQPC